MQQIEDRFNKRARYPWTFLSDQSFSQDFRARTSAMTDSPTVFDVIPAEHWGPPAWINSTRAEQVRENMKLLRIPQGDSIRFRNLSRFNAGFLAKQEILRSRRPGAQYFCDFLEDPFQVMRDEGKIYAFNLAPFEMDQTVSTLWETVYDFIQEHNLHLHTGSNLARFVTKDDSYTLCYYDNNFEVVDMDFLRSSTYSTFFDYLDKKGGIFYERWGSGPILSIALSLFLPKEKLSFQQNIGYRFGDMQHCPNGNAYTTGRCACDPKDNFGESCPLLVITVIHKRRITRF
ncbi:glycosyltransferase family 15 protein [Multifurca ochricompacta]|uniref:Glycosyltransferase family 15 protein n=1 Tax=Multifurca ochricompacta TaxID=376703 RepID=A0AAD4MBI2_9AGAM|nr:glycosyltransferase family 15 protein [Multifurca ochricompacta]